MIVSSLSRFPNFQAYSQKTHSSSFVKKIQPVETEPAVLSLSGSYKQFLIAASAVIVFYILIFLFINFIETVQCL